MSESTMTPQRALSFLDAFAPCAHTSYDGSLGDGRTWVKCYDCDETIERSRLEQARKRAEEFEAATDAIARLINENAGVNIAPVTRDNLLHSGTESNVALVMRAFRAWRATPQTGTPATDDATARAFGEMLAEAFVADAKEQGK